MAKKLTNENKIWRLKNEAFLRDVLQKSSLKFKNEAFLRDFLQKSTFEDKKHKISTRFPSKREGNALSNNFSMENGFKRPKLNRISS